MQSFLNDLHYAARNLARQPSFTAIAVFTLAVGIGANTAIYSVVDATILRPLPFREPSRLMAVSLVMPSMRGRAAEDKMVWSYPKSEFFRQNQQAFEQVALYRNATFNLTGVDEPERLAVEQVSASYFPLLGIRPAFGRHFLAEEDVTADKSEVALISHSLWTRRFAADPRALGKTLTLDGRMYSIVGVVPAGFQGLSGPVDVYVPVHSVSQEDLSQPLSHSWSMVARLKPRVTAEQARRVLPELGGRIDAAFGQAAGPHWSLTARTLDEARVDPAIRKAVLVLFGAVTFVLLIACVNIANLLLARGTSRGREIAIRVAIGAGRFRLIRQLLTESLLLAILGAVASVALAWLGVQALSTLNPAAGGPFARSASGLTALSLSTIRLDSRALLFSLGAALFTGILFGLAPAIQGSRADLATALKNSSGAAGRTRTTGRNLLVVAEVALSVILLVGAGLMIKSFTRLMQTRIGVDPANVLTLRITLSSNRFTPAATVDLLSRLEERAAAIPGVISAGLGNCPALSGGCSGTVIWFRDKPPVPRGSEPLVGLYFASPSYFRTMKVPLLRGRFFAASDRKETAKVVVISDTAARRFFPGEDPIGRRVAVGQGGFGDSAEIIGVAADVRYGQMDELPIPDVYLSHLQSPRFSTILFVRSSGDAAALANAVRSEVRNLNRDLPLWDIQTMEERIGKATARARFSTLLLGVFAAIALVLAAVGIYGVMSYLVTQRVREIGIRVALGAGTGQVLGLILRRGLGLTLAGIVAGVAGALAATRVLATQLYEVRPGDPATYLLMPAMLAAVALVATYIPARRAMSIDPATTLRAD